MLASYVDCLLTDSQHNQYDSVPIAVNTVLRLLMMVSKSVRNM